MNILHVIADLEIGGAQKMLTELLPYQSISNNRITLLILGTYNQNFVDTVKNSGINIITADKKSIYSPSNLFFLLKHTNEYDVLHIHLFPMLYYYAFLKLLRPKLILVYTEHNTHNKRRNQKYLRGLERFVYSQYERVCCISEETKNNLLNWLYQKKISEKKKSQYEVIYNGIDINKYANAIPAGLDCCAGNKVIMMVSRFSLQKDHETLIKAFAKLCEKQHDIRLVFVGDGVSKGRMQKLVDELHLTNYTYFLGNRNDIPSLIKCAYLGVQSSKWEGFGLTAVEFMASGRPIVATNVHGLSSVVKGGGVLFQQGQVEELCDAINLLLNDRLYYNSIAKKGEEKSKNYSIEFTAKNYINLYRELVK